MLRALSSRGLGWLQVGPLSMGEEVAVNVEEGKQSKKKKKKQQDKVYKDFTDFYAKRWGLPIAVQGQPLLEVCALWCLRGPPYIYERGHQTRQKARRRAVAMNRPCRCRSHCVD